MIKICIKSLTHPLKLIFILTLQEGVFPEKKRKVI